MHLIQGTPALPGVDVQISTGPDGEDPLVWSASVSGRSIWLAVTPRRGQTAVRLAVNLGKERADLHKVESTTVCVVTATNACEHTLVGLYDKVAKNATTDISTDVPIDAKRVDESTIVLFITKH